MATAAPAYAVQYYTQAEGVTTTSTASATTSPTASTSGQHVGLPVSIAGLSPGTHIMITDAAPTAAGGSPTTSGTRGRRGAPKQIQVAQAWTGASLFNIFAQLPVEEREHFMQLVMETNEFHLLAKIAADSNKMVYELISTTPTSISVSQAEADGHQTVEQIFHQEAIHQDQQQHHFEYQTQYEAVNDVDMVEEAPVPSTSSPQETSNKSATKSTRRGKRGSSGAPKRLTANDESNADPNNAQKDMMTMEEIIALVEQPNQGQQQQHQHQPQHQPPQQQQSHQQQDSQELGAPEVEVNDSPNTGGGFTNWGRRKKKKPFKKTPIDRPLMKPKPSEEEKPYKCPIEACGKSYKYKSDYEVHHDQHERIKPFICQCRKEIWGFEEFEAHKEKEHPRPFGCQFEGCDYRALVRRQVKRHYVTHHSASPDLPVIRIESYKKFRYSKFLELAQNDSRFLESDPQRIKIDVLLAASDAAKPPNSRASRSRPKPLTQSPPPPALTTTVQVVTRSRSPHKKTLT